MENTVINVSDKGQLVLAYLKANTDGALGAVIAEAQGLNSRGIHGVINPLFNNELVGKEVIKYQGLNKDGEAEEKEGTKYFITPAGAAWTAPVVEAE